MARFLEDDEDYDRPGQKQSFLWRRANLESEELKRNLKKGVLERVFGICKADPKQGREASSVIHPQSPFATGSSPIPPSHIPLAHPWVTHVATARKRFPAPSFLKSNFAPRHLQKASFNPHTTREPFLPLHRACEGKPPLTRAVETAILLLTLQIHDSGQNCQNCQNS
jgi:hypothetical protein